MRKDRKPARTWPSVTKLITAIQVGTVAAVGVWVAGGLFLAWLPK